MSNYISRRDSLKYITLASLSAGMFTACEPGASGEHAHQHDATEGFKDLSPRDLALLEQRWFTDHERETVRVLANLIIPEDERSGNAEAAGVPQFIEFIMLDEPTNRAGREAFRQRQTLMRGGLRWMDVQCLERYNRAFIACSVEQQHALLDDIAYPDTAPPEMSQGVAFFNFFRDLVATGFWTSKMGIEDLQYLGNTATVWQGPPQEWIERLGVEDVS